VTEPPKCRSAICCKTTMTGTARSARLGGRIQLHGRKLFILGRFGSRGGDYIRRVAPGVDAGLVRSDCATKQVTYDAALPVLPLQAHHRSRRAL
jgi:hypothetical protein